MNAVTPIYASERSAAKLLDLKPAEFRALVEMGALPAPKNIAGYERWRVSELDAIASGQMLDHEDFET